MQSIDPNDCDVAPLQKFELILEFRYLLGCTFSPRPSQRLFHYRSRSFMDSPIVPNLGYQTRCLSNRATTYFPDSSPLEPMRRLTPRNHETPEHQQYHAKPNYAKPTPHATHLHRQHTQGSLGLWMTRMHTGFIYDNLQTPIRSHTDIYPGTA